MPRKLGQPLKEDEWFRRPGELKASTGAMRHKLQASASGIAIDGITVAPTEDAGAYAAETQGGNVNQARRRDQLRSQDHQNGAKGAAFLEGTLMAGLLNRPQVRTSGKELLYQLNIEIHELRNANRIFNDTENLLKTSRIEPGPSQDKAVAYKNAFITEWDNLVQISQWNMPLQGGQQPLAGDLPPVNTVVEWIKANNRGVPAFETAEINRKFRLLKTRAAPYDQLAGNRDVIEAALTILEDAEEDAAGLDMTGIEDAYSFQETPDTSRSGGGRATERGNREHANRGRGSGERRNKGRARGGKGRTSHADRRKESSSAEWCRNKFESKCKFGIRCRYKHKPEPRGNPGPPPKTKPGEHRNECQVCGEGHLTKNCRFVRKSRRFLESGQSDQHHERRERSMAVLAAENESLGRANAILKDSMSRAEGFEANQQRASDWQSGFLGKIHPSEPTVLHLKLNLIDGSSTNQPRVCAPSISACKQGTTERAPEEGAILGEKTNLEHALALSSSQRAQHAILDSGATACYVFQKSNLKDYKEFAKTRTVRDAGNKSHRIEGAGTMELVGKDSAETVEIHGVGYTPSLRCNLISTGQLRKQGHDVILLSGQCGRILTRHAGAVRNVDTFSQGGLEWLTIVPPHTPRSWLWSRRVTWADELNSGDGKNQHAHPVVNKRTIAMHSKTTVPNPPTSPTTQTAKLLSQLKQAQTPQKTTALRMQLAELGCYTTPSPMTDQFLAWHDAIGHRNPEITSAMARYYGLKFPKTAARFCHSCAIAKSKRKPRAKQPKHALTLPAFWSQQIDIAGPFPSSRLDNFKYLLGAVCNSTRSSKVYGLRNLREVRQTLRKHLKACAELEQPLKLGWQDSAEILPDKTITTSQGYFRPTAQQFHIQTDSHSVFVGKETADLFREHKCKHTQSASYSQNRNGKIERLFQSHSRTSDAMREARNLDESWWFWSWRHANTLIDVIPHEGLGGKTPYELRNGARLTSIAHLSHPLGSTVYVHNNARKSKQEPRAVKGKYVGWHEPSASHLVLNDSTGRLFKTVDATFDRTLPRKILTGEMKLNREKDVTQAFEYLENEDTAVPQAVETNVEQTPADTEQPGDAPAVAIDADTIIIQDPTATVYNPIDLGDGIIDLGPQVNAMISDTNTNTFKTQVSEDVLGKLTFNNLTSAIKADPKFKDASTKEWQQLFDRNIIKEVWRSEVHKAHYVHRSCQIFTLKLDERGNPRKLKGRSCIDGRTFVQGVDYESKDSPCPSQTTIRMLIAAAAHHGRRLMDFDVPGAYLNVNRETIVYAHYPHDQRKYEFNPHTRKREEKLLQVHGNWYGSPSGGRQWYLHWIKTLKELGFKQSNLDPCLLYRGTGAEYTALLTHVDDGLLYSMSTKAEAQLIAELTAKFGDIGAAPAKFYLGMNIHQFEGAPERGIYLTHESMIDKNHQKFKVKTKQVDTPLPTRASISKGDRLPETATPIDYNYRGVNGYTSYCAQATRPDMAFATSQLARVQSAPSQEHADLCERAANYLHHTRTLGIHYKYQTSGLTVAYSDASWQDIPSYCDCKDCKLKAGHRSTAEPTNAEGGRATKPTPSTPKTSGTPSTCDTCGERFTSRRKLFEHLGSSLSTGQQCPHAPQTDTPTEDPHSGSKRRRPDDLSSETTPPQKKQHADENDSRASSYGWIVYMCGAPVFWKSTVSKGKPTSTHESELIAAYHTARHMRHIRWLAAEMGFPTTKPTPLHIDNDGVLATCLRIAVPSKSRHIERKYFNLKEWRGDVEPTPICTKENFSDIMTKSLAKDQHYHLLKGIMTQAPSVHDK